MTKDEIKVKLLKHINRLGCTKINIHGKQFGRTIECCNTEDLAEDLAKFIKRNIIDKLK